MLISTDLVNLKEEVEGMPVAPGRKQTLVHFRGSTQLGSASDTRVRLLKLFADQPDCIVRCSCHFICALIADC